MGRKRKETSGVDEHIRAVANHYIERMQSGEKITIISILEELLNALMLAERDLYLRIATENQANGFYSRDLQLTIGRLGLKVPRVRYGNKFRPSLLPERWKRVDKDYENLLVALLANGYSRSRIKNTLEELGLPYSEVSIEELVNLIYDHLTFYKETPIENEMFAVFIDAYHGKIRDENGKVCDSSIYVGVGIDMNGHKVILGWWVKQGKESKAFWAEVLQDLISRGLSRVGIFVTDDFPGLVELLPRYFPISDHQLCLVHLRRNLKREIGRKEYSEVSKLLKRIKESQSKNEAEGYWEKLVEIVKKKKPRIGQRLEKRKDNYLAFTSYPEEIRKYIYTTNVVESINSGLELMRLELGGYFPSIKSLEVNLFVQLSNLNDRWMRKPIPMIQANLYRIIQLMNIKFNLDLDYTNV